MEWYLVLLLILGSLMIVLLSGLPAAFAFMLLNLIGVFIFWGGQAGLHQLILSIVASLSGFVLLPIPLFIFLGEVLFQSGVGLRAIDVLDKWLGRLPGRLGLLTVGASAMFSTMSGSSIATTAMLGSLLLPEMEKRGYKKPIAIGSIMGSGGLAMIIPPSAVAVLVAAVAKIHVGGLLIAGIIPGILIAFFYAGYIILRCMLQPSIAPSYEVTPIPLSEKLKDTAKYVLPLAIIVFLVTGVIFLGVATPSEAAATGALGSVIVVALYKQLNWNMMKKAIMGTVQLSVMMFMIILSATAFGQILAYSGASRGLVEFAVSLPIVPVLLIITMQVVLLILGTFMSGLPILMITLPIFMPLIYAIGFNPLCFGLLVLINIEIAQTSPPFGYLLFAMKGVAPPGTTMGDIYRAGLPFIGCDLIVMALIIAFPPVALWLPNVMR